MNSRRDFSPGSKNSDQDRQRYAGLGRGMHLSPKRGSSLEFNDYRHYSGRCFRYIDWASTGAATNCTSSFFRRGDLLTYIFVMRARRWDTRRRHKFESAMVTALALAYVAPRVADRVMCGCSGGTERKSIRRS